jgi:NAD(P)-dependent dehydrogenase (short-subunit alcohol dehydrogenase family)
VDGPHLGACFSLKNRVAVVTGGGEGIGEGIARRLHAAGANVAVLNEGAAELVAQSIEGIAAECDVTSDPSVQGAIDRVREALGPIDSVVNDAGITVNSIAPRVVRTKILDSIAPQTVQYMLSKMPMGRTGKIEEVAALVHFLVSSEASFTTGQRHDISGGRATY